MSESDFDAKECSRALDGIAEKMVALADMDSTEDVIAGAVTICAGTLIAIGAILLELHNKVESMERDGK